MNGAEMSLVHQAFLKRVAPGFEPGVVETAMMIVNLMRMGFETRPYDPKMHTCLKDRQISEP
jgi:hypothetical protein